MARILLIEDEPDVRSLLLAAFEWHGHEARAAGQCVEPEVVRECDLECCGETGAPDLAVIAVITPRHCSGIEVAQKALAKWPSIRILLISTFPPDLWPEPARRLLRDLPDGSYSFLPKPFSIQDLTAAVQRLIAPDLRET